MANHQHGCGFYSLFLALVWEFGCNGRSTKRGGMRSIGKFITASLKELLTRKNEAAFPGNFLLKLTHWAGYGAIAQFTSESMIKSLSYKGMKSYSLLVLKSFVILFLLILAAAFFALPSFLPSHPRNVNRGKQAEGKQYTSSINKAQQAYYVENGKFVTENSPEGWERLAVGIKTQTINYKYSISAIGKDGVNTFADASQINKALKSYTGVVGLISDPTNPGEKIGWAIICETKNAGDVPLPGEVTATKVKCPDNSYLISEFDFFATPNLTSSNSNSNPSEFEPNPPDLNSNPSPVQDTPCWSKYSPEQARQRWRGRAPVGHIEIVNDSDQLVRVILFHPDSDGGLFATWDINPGRSTVLAINNQRITIGADWGIRVASSCIIPVGDAGQYSQGKYKVMSSFLFNY